MIFSQQETAATLIDEINGHESVLEYLRSENLDIRAGYVESKKRGALVRLEAALGETSRYFEHGGKSYRWNGEDRTFTRLAFEKSADIPAGVP